MLEKIDLSKSMKSQKAKEIYEEQSKKLSALQRECKEAKIPVMIIFEGLGAAGKGTQINKLIQALDPRGFHVFSIGKETEEEKLHPFLWRFWVKTPEKGRIAIFDRSWYRRVLSDRFDKLVEEKEMQNAFSDIQFFEKQLTEDGMVIIKLFLYISKKEQKKRFQSLLDSKETAWRVTKDDLKRNEEYEKYLEMNEEMLKNTDTENAPWTIIESTDKDYAYAKIITSVVNRLEEALQNHKNIAQLQEKIKENMADMPKDRTEENYFKAGALSKIDLTKSLEQQDYKEELERLQKRLRLLHNDIYRMRIPVVLAFEGWDAAGKGGVIKRLTSALDPRGYAVYPTASPNDIEKMHHYLWRFWNNVPKAGHISIFDRTWYGRVMVERIEGFCSEIEWKRAYQEINEMEEHLANSGAAILKFWMHIDKEEQKRRFQERMDNPEKQWKITEEDWRNREKWDLYEEAVDEMLIRTSTSYAPWVIVEGNSKYYARIKVLKTVVKTLEEAINLRK